MDEKQEKLSLVFHPLQGDEGKLSVSSFANTIDALRKAANKFSCSDLKILSLSSNSPVAMTVEGDGQLSGFYDGLNEFMQSRKIPGAWSRSKIDAVLEFLAPIGKSVGRLDLASNDQELVINTEYRIDFQNSIESDFSAYGTIDGMLDALNIHGKNNTLTIYPTIGKNKITCGFDNSYLDQVRENIGLYVEISGEMVYRWRDKYPHTGKLEKIEVIKEDDLPTFADIYGMAPNATQGMPAEDFVARIRSEWESH